MANDEPPSNPDPTFEKWRKRFGYYTGMGLSADEKEHRAIEVQMNVCNKRKEYLMNNSPTIKFMLQHLNAMGCAPPPENVFCTPCEGPLRAGGFERQTGSIVLCAGRFFGQDHVESTLVHEMIHMFDQCRFKVNWDNLRHHACSEIRANSLSGDCRFSRELNRGVVAFTKNHQGCVRRRAIMSLEANSACPNKEAAEKAVNEVFESCFADTRPFEEIY
ncbi:metalloprotease ATP23 [Flagelloscypha sp. PMI_526]|nr:metalloprotease ATP23 [Flagelloscypha sp. PMI_526]